MTIDHAMEITPDLPQLQLPPGTQRTGSLPFSVRELLGCQLLPQ